MENEAAERPSLGRGGADAERPSPANPVGEARNLNVNQVETGNAERRSRSCFSGPQAWIVPSAIRQLGLGSTDGCFIRAVLSGVPWLSGAAELRVRVTRSGVLLSQSGSSMIVQEGG